MPTEDVRFLVGRISVDPPNNSILHGSRRGIVLHDWPYLFHHFAFDCIIAILCHRRVISLTVRVSIQLEFHGARLHQRTLVCLCQCLSVSSTKSFSKANFPNKYLRVACLWFWSILVVHCFKPRWRI